MSSFGQNFPLSDYYRGNVIDGRTITRTGRWWTAALLIKDPKTEEPFVALYRWEKMGEEWKKRKSISFKTRPHVDAVVEALEEFSTHI